MSEVSYIVKSKNKSTDCTMFYPWPHNPMNWDKGMLCPENLVFLLDSLIHISSYKFTYLDFPMELNLWFPFSDLMSTCNQLFRVPMGKITASLLIVVSMYLHILLVFLLTLSFIFCFTFCFLQEHVKNFSIHTLSSPGSRCSTNH